MGNPKWRAPSDERPQHKIFLDAYRIGKYPVTNKEYEKFLIATGWERPECWDIQDFNRPNRPVIRVRWYDAVAYCEWLAKISGKNYRLPTEAEWEKVARGGLEGKRYPWGNKKPDDKLINFERREAFLSLFNKNTDTYVGSYPPNEYGLYDMIGKVWQWVADWYDENYYKKSPDNNPQGPASGKYRVLRGGPCGGNLDGFRVTRRKWDEGGDKDEKLRCFGVLSKGFRIAISD
jgi:formylglycine-generating enzyme required for sulfatase activity